MRALRDLRLPHGVRQCQRERAPVRCANEEGSKTRSHPCGGVFRTSDHRGGRTGRLGAARAHRPGYEEAVQTLRAMAERVTRRRRESGVA